MEEEEQQSVAKKVIKYFSFILIGFIFVASIYIIFTTIAQSNASGSESGEESSASNTIRFLNFKPEITEFMKDAAKDFEKETGYRVIVDTATNNKYEETLTAKMTGNEAPTLFNINGVNGLKSWKDYCADVSNSWAIQHLTDKDMALKGEDNKYYGIPYVVEGYGIIYNKAITDKYFALSNRQQEVSSMDEIKSFDKLKMVVEDMTKHKDELNIQGVFSSTSLKSGHDFRWQTHLANVATNKEFEDRHANLSSSDVHSIDFRYSENFKNIFDLYINNSIVDRKRLGTVSVTDSMAEFALGRSAMVQNGNWSWGQIKGVKNKAIEEQNIKFLPIYMGLPNEEHQGLCVGTENFYAINKKSTEKQQEIANKFIEWMYSSEKGKDYVVNKFGFITSFDTFNTNDVPSDPLGKQLSEWMHNKDVKSIPWSFTVYPSLNWKNRFGANLLRYSQGQKSWDDVKDYVVDLWNKEYTTTIYDN